MKRILTGICTLLLLAAFTTPAAAQKVSVGLKAGPNFATLAGDDVGEDIASLTRLIGGGFMVIEFGRNFAFQPELLYAQKGGKENDPGDIIELKLDYIEVPLLLRVHPNVTGRFLPHALVGPTIAYNTSCEMYANENGVEITEACEDNLPIKDIDFGLAFGGGVDMAVGNAFIVLDLRYQLGLTKIDDDTNPSDVYNRGFAIMAGFRYPLGGYTQTAGLK